MFYSTSGCLSIWRGGKSRVPPPGIFVLYTAAGSGSAGTSDQSRTSNLPVKMRLSDLKGKVVLINFWATWCAPCRIEIPILKSLYAELKDHPFEILAVASEPPERVLKFLKENPVNYPVLLDLEGTVASQYKISVYPTLVFVDRAGRIEEVSHGFNPLLKWKLRYKVTGSIF